MALLSYSSIQSQTITPKQRDVITIDNGVTGKADPGDRIMYDVTISNSGGTQGSNTQLNVVPDPRTTFVAGSFKSSPLALDDNYTATGNIGITIPAGTGVLANDFDDNIPGLTVTAGTFATTQGGTIVLASNGSFSYTPKAGFTGSDQYVYTLNDGNPVGAPVPNTNTGTITFTVSQMVWFIDNSATMSANTGTFTDPFTSIAAFNTANTGASLKPQDNDFISLRRGTGSYSEADGINLRNGQKLIGEAVQFNTVFTADANSLAAYQTFASGTMTAPVIAASAGNGVDILVGNTLRGFNIGNCSGMGINGLGFGTLTLNTISINSTGQAMTLINGTIAGAGFSSVSSSGGVNNISLGTLSGTLTLGSGALSGSSGASFFASQGTATVTYSGTINKTTGTRMVDIENLTGGSYTFSGSLTHNAATVAQESVFLNLNTGATINFNGGLTLTSTSTAAVFSAITGGTVNVTGASNTISSTVGTGLNLQSTNAGGSGITFASIICTSGQVANINSSTGTKTLGRIVTSSGATTALSLTSAGTVNAGDASLASTLNTSSGTGIVINATTLNLTGLGVSATASGNGIGLNMTGGTVSITGKIVLNTNSGIGFNATSGGTVSLTGSANTINSTAATALNISNTNIGASNMNFLSISANGAANGIILNTTGASGGLIVTGTGSTNGSGGTIQSISSRGVSATSTSNLSLKNITFTNANTSDGAPCGAADNSGCNAAIYLNTVTNATLDNVDINGAAQQGINLREVNGFSLLNSTIINGGAGGQTEESDLYALNLYGTCAITNSSLTVPAERAAVIYNTNKTMSLSVTGSTFGMNQTQPLGADGLEVDSYGTSNTTLNITSSTFIQPKTNGLQVITENNSFSSVNISGCTFDPGSGLAAAIDLDVNNSGDMDFNIINNPMIKGKGINIINIFAFPSATFEGRINSNTVVNNGGSGTGIRVVSQGNGNSKVEIMNNTVTGADDYGIDVTSQLGTGRVDATIKNNNVTVGVNGFYGIHVIAGASGSTFTNKLCANVANNIANVPGTAIGNFQARSATATHEILLQGGGATVAANWSSNTNSPLPGITSQSGAGIFTFGATCSVPMNP